MMVMLNFQQTLLQSHDPSEIMKTFLLFNVLRKPRYICLPWMLWIKCSQHLFEMLIFGMIINVFTVSFGQFNVFLLNKSK